MSRLGKLPIQIPEGTQVKFEKDVLFIKSNKAELQQNINKIANIEISEKEITVSVKNSNNKNERAIWGLVRSLVNNMVIGVNSGFEKKLEINGVGYKAAVNGKKLTINVGYSHPVEFEIPENISITVEGNIISVSGADKQIVGETAARIKKVRKPEPYKGKGIKYENEIIRRKAGKTAAKSEK